MATLEEQVGAAWANARVDRYNDAVRDFENIVKSNPNDVDALYGLGLALRKVGRKDEAISMFEKAHKLAQELITSEAEGQEPVAMSEDKLHVQGQNTRFLMLSRMLQQRIAETKNMA